MHAFAALPHLRQLNAALTARAQPAPDTPRATEPAGGFVAMDRYIQEQLDRLHVPDASVAIVEGDRIVHLQGFGRAGPGRGRPSSQTPFMLGSTTKSFTALAVMQLVEAGKVELDAPVRRYLPWFRVADPEASDRMTVRHLLNQTSGISQVSGWPTLADVDNRPGAGERQARALATLRVARPVGAAFEYSNTNYLLLGLIVEAASGESYAAYVRRHIFGPLDMRHSYASRAEARRHGLATGHRFWFGFPVASPSAESPIGSLPAGQLISSAEDMAHYLIAQLNGGRHGDATILSADGIAEMHRPVAEVKVMGMSMGRYAMGWFIEDRGNARIAWHDGVVQDFFSYMAIVPDQHRGIVLLLNADHFLMQLYGSEVGMGLAMRLAGLPPDPIRLGVLPWAPRLMVAIPVLQAVGIVQSLRPLRVGRRRPTCASPGRGWVLGGLAPVGLNLGLVAVPIVVRRKGLAGFVSLFAPDLWLLARMGGALGGISIAAVGALAIRQRRGDV